MSEVGTAEESLATRCARNTQTGRQTRRTTEYILLRATFPAAKLFTPDGVIILAEGHDKFFSGQRRPEKIDFFVCVCLCGSVAKNVFFFPVKIDR